MKSPVKYGSKLKSAQDSKLSKKNWSQGWNLYKQWVAEPLCLSHVFILESKDPCSSSTSATAAHHCHMMLGASWFQLNLVCQWSFNAKPIQKIVPKVMKSRKKFHEPKFFVGPYPLLLCGKIMAHSFLLSWSILLVFVTLWFLSFNVLFFPYKLVM